MTQVTGTIDTLYASVQQFYADQMHLLDDGRAEEWAATFTADATFDSNNRPQPSAGRDAIQAGAARAIAERRAKGLTRRHWLGMLSVKPQDDGSVVTHCYALIISTPQGGPTAVHLSTTCDDVLVPDQAGPGGWLVRSRYVSHDDIV